MPVAFPLGPRRQKQATTATSATSGTANFSTGLIHAVGDKPEVCHTAIFAVAMQAGEHNHDGDKQGQRRHRQTTPAWQSPPWQDGVRSQLASGGGQNSLSTWVVSVANGEQHGKNTAIATWGLHESGCVEKSCEKRLL